MDFAKELAAVDAVIASRVELRAKVDPASDLGLLAQLIAWQKRGADSDRFFQIDCIADGPFGWAVRLEVVSRQASVEARGCDNLSEAISESLRLAADSGFH